MIARFSRSIFRITLYSRQERAFSEEVLNVGVVDDLQDDDEPRPIEILNGIHSVFGALSAEKRTVYEVLMKHSFLDDEPSRRVRPLLKLCKTLDIPITPVSKKDLFELTDTNQNQGVAARVSEKEILPIEKLEMESDKLIVGLEAIQDPHNLGAILRSCLFFGVSKVIVPNHNSCPLSPTVSKVSVGALEEMDVYSSQGGDLRQLIESSPNLSKRVVVGTSSPPPLTKAQQKIEKIDISKYWSSYDIGDGLHRIKKKKNNNNDQRREGNNNRQRRRRDDGTLLLFGNEGNGLTKNLLQSCDLVTFIPSSTENSKSYQHTMNKNRNIELLDSLNVSVSAGIIISQLSRYV